MNENIFAPGKPGNLPNWPSSAKSAIGKALNSASDITFTINQGILTEVFYPQEDHPCLREAQLLIADGKDFFSEEKKDATHLLETLEEGIPAYKIINECKIKTYRIEKEIVTDPFRNTLLQHITFTALAPQKDLHLYFLVAPNIAAEHEANRAFLGEYKGVCFLFAEGRGKALAIACSSPWIKRSVGYAGVSDGWQDLKENKHMSWEYQQTEQGNVTLTAELDLKKENKFLVAIGFGATVDEAANHAHASILDGYSFLKEQYISEWRTWQSQVSKRTLYGSNYRHSLAVLRINESKKYPGAIIASPSIPWGIVKKKTVIGGYHVVWPRDLVESAQVFLSLNAKYETLRILNYLLAIQEENGKWSQNTWLDGKPNWTGNQMDQVALPLILAGACLEKGYLDKERLRRYWPNLRKAIIYLLLNGPFTNQGRWEESLEGYSPYTISTEIAALIYSARIAQANQESDLAHDCLEKADCWDESIEKLCYVVGTPLAKEAGVEGYYIRSNPKNVFSEKTKDQNVHLSSYAGVIDQAFLTEIVSVDALALVRFGLRAADDPRILNTIKVIDKHLKVETPFGPSWHRFSYDSYGEHPDGSPFDGRGIGRLWPLLTGERAHYEIAAGNYSEAKRLLRTFEGFSNNGLFPEQVWDTADIPEHNLFFGHYTGSAMPLTWAHAEYLKLCLSLRAKNVIDMPVGTYKRYVKKIKKENK